MVAEEVQVLRSILDLFPRIDEDLERIKLSGRYNEVDPSLDDIIGLVSDNSHIFTSFEIQEREGPRLFFELSGDTIRNVGLDDLDEAEADYDEIELSSFQRRRDEGDWERAGSHLDTICANIDSTVGLSVTAIVNKSQVVNEIESDASPTFAGIETNSHFWLSEGSFLDWVENELPPRIGEVMFDANRLPILFFDDKSELTIDQSVVAGTDTLDQLDADSLQQALVEYRASQSQVREYVSWDEHLTPVHPKPVNTIYDYCASGSLSHLLVYYNLGLFCRSVSQEDDVTKFSIELNPELEIRLEDTQFHEGFSDSVTSGLEELFDNFSPESTEPSFRGLWQRALAETIAGRQDGIDDELEKLELIVENRNEITETLERLERQVIKEDFEGLSDALDETQALMADITSRLSDAATESSRRIQGLGFTLLGAIIANIFLVLRWSENRLVIPFTIFVTILILTFYLPLIQGQIDDLDRVIRESENDFILYRDRIRQFNQELFEFSQLESRINSYQEIARKQRDRAQNWVDTSFYVLLALWTVLAAISAVAFSVDTLHFLSIIVSVLLFTALVLPFDYSPAGNDYFERHIVIIVIVFGVVLIGLSLWIDQNPDAYSWFDSLPRFQSNNQ
jgi:hypothetical protein